jgi:hypothetical protein
MRNSILLLAFKDPVLLIYFQAGTYDLTYLLKVKQSELRLYCDLLSQQTHEIKSLIMSLNTSTHNHHQHTASESSIDGSGAAAGFDKSQTPREGALSAASNVSLKEGGVAQQQQQHQRGSNLADASSILSSSFKSLNYSTTEDQLTSPVLTSALNASNSNNKNRVVCQEEDEFDDAQASSGDMFHPKEEKFQIVVDSENIKVGFFFVCFCLTTC